MSNKKDVLTVLESKFNKRLSELRASQTDSRHEIEKLKIDILNSICDLKLFYNRHEIIFKKNGYGYAINIDFDSMKIVKDMNDKIKNSKINSDMEILSLKEKYKDIKDEILLFGINEELIKLIKDF